MGSNEAINFGFDLSTWMPFIVTIVGGLFVYLQTKRQISREFVAKERSEWLKETRNRYSKYIELVSSVFSMAQVQQGLTDIQKEEQNKIIDEIYSQVYEHCTYLTMMFNPNDEEILNLIGEILSYTQRYASSEHQSDKDKLKGEVANVINRMNVCMRTYFKHEWDQIKKDISYKKKNKLFE